MMSVEHPDPDFRNLLLVLTIQFCPIVGVYNLTHTRMFLESEENQDKPSDVRNNHETTSHGELESRKHVDLQKKW